MAKDNNYLLANFILGLAFMGLLISYPFHTGFVGGIIASICSAALVGGIADWFAITALFRRPLGLPPGKLIRTEIIPHNRDRLLAALADMVEKELLTKEELGHRIEAYDFANLLIGFLHTHQNDLQDFSVRLSRDILSKVDRANMAQFIEELFVKTATPAQAGLLIGRALELFVAEGYDESLLSLLRQEMLQLMEHPETDELVIHFFADVKSGFGQGNFLRKVMLNFLPSSEEMAELVRIWVRNLSPEQLHKWLRPWLSEIILELKTNTRVQRQLNNLLLDLGRTKAPQIAAGLTEKAADPSPIIQALSSYGEALLLSLENNLHRRHELNTWIQQGATYLLEAYHSHIHSFVLSGLERFSDEDIVKLVESRAGHDLQMIRLTGTLVGGTVGACLFIFTSLLH